MLQIVKGEPECGEPRWWLVHPNTEEFLGYAFPANGGGFAVVDNYCGNMRGRGRTLDAARADFEVWCAWAGVL